ncbi:MAG: cysteine desulfurase [Chlorobi bacterium]|nr:cysteine desulfurase [Chlorobiota bacterium]
MKDINTARTDFPILAREVNGKPLVYLDNAATMQKPQAVIDAVSRVYTDYNSNIHRGTHFLSNVCTGEFENAREKIQKFINARNSYEIIFTRGTTEAINLVANTFGDNFLSEDDEVIVSELEHHSNIVPWQLLRERKGIKLKVIPLNEDGELVLDEYYGMLNEKTRLVAVAHVSNALGTVNPVKEIIEAAHKMNAKVLIDGAQAVHHFPVDMRELDADFYVFSGHKLYGPTGIGVLYGKEELLNKMPPWHGGGEMIKNVTFEKTTYNELPFRFEAGTPDYAGAIGLGAAVDYLSSYSWEDIVGYEKELLDYATEKLSAIDGLKIYGTAEKKSGVVSFLVGKIHPYDMGVMLDKLGIAVRTGHHCAQPVMDRYGIPGTVRASFAIYNTKEEVDKLVDGIEKVKKIFG